MMITSVVFCVMILGASSQTIKLTMTPSSIPMTIDDHLKAETSFEDTKKAEETSQSPEISAKNLLKEVGTNHKQTVEESIYNENKTLKICWKNVVYVNESNGVFKPWQEYQVVFHFPSEGNQEAKNDTQKEYKHYALQTAENHVEEYDFEVIETHPSYTISKHEDTLCGSGKFLSKTYYEWPQAAEEKLVIRLTDEMTGLGHDRPGFVGDVNANEDLSGDLSFEDSSSKENTTGELNNNKTGAHIEDGSVLNPYELEAVASASSETTEESDKTTNTPIDLTTTPEATTLLSDHVLSSVDPCSPLLTQLLSGNGIFSGLCNLKKDEKVLLQGDIIVSKKFFDPKNQTEVVQPMFVIHENTEIETDRSKIQLI